MPESLWRKRFHRTQGQMRRDLFPTFLRLASRDIFVVVAVCINGTDDRTGDKDCIAGGSVSVGHAVLPQVCTGVLGERLRTP